MMNLFLGIVHPFQWEKVVIPIARLGKKDTAAHFKIQVYDDDVGKDRFIGETDPMTFDAVSNTSLDSLTLYKWKEETHTKKKKGELIVSGVKKVKRK